MGAATVENTQIEVRATDTVWGVVGVPETNLEAVSPANLAQIRVILDQLASALEITGDVCELQQLKDGVAQAQAAYLQLPEEVTAQLERYLPVTARPVPAALLDNLPHLEGKAAMTFRVLITLLLFLAAAALSRTQ